MQALIPAPFSVCRVRQDLRAPPSSSRHVAARGILDSYRREKGITVPEEQAAAAPSSSGASSAVAPPPAAGQARMAQLLDLDTEDEVHFTEDDTPCPVDCVIELFTPEDLSTLMGSTHPETLVVVDYYKTACGACKYISTGFIKLCKATQEENPAVLFAKHNVFDDEEEEVTALGRQLQIKNVPLFVFYKNGEELERFATRDKYRVAAAITQHSSLSEEDMDLMTSGDEH